MEKVGEKSCHVCVCDRKTERFPLRFYLSYALLSQGNWMKNEKMFFWGPDTVQWGMKAPSCVCPVAPPSDWHCTHLQFRHLPLLITVFLPTFLSSFFMFPVLSSPLVFSPLLSLLCTYKKGRRGAFGSCSNRTERASVLVRVRLKSGGWFEALTPQL